MDLLPVIRKLYHNDKLIDAHCYAGKGVWKNDPHAQSRPGEGPIPQGKYTIGSPFNNIGKTGPYSIRLQPDPHNRMFGRSAFLIHGDSLKHPDNASEGCIIANLRTRHEIVLSGDRVLEVRP